MSENLLKKLGKKHILNLILVSNTAHAVLIALLYYNSGHALRFNVKPKWL